MPLVALAIAIGYFWVLDLSLLGTILSLGFFVGLWAIMRKMILDTEGGVSQSSPVTVFLMVLGSCGTLIGIIAALRRVFE